MNRICVNCGSSPGKDPLYRGMAVSLGTFLGERDIELVYGGADVGLMGDVANAVLRAGGNVTGVITQSLAEKVCHHNLTELIVVNTMHERKMKMFELSDAFIVLPGGFGTLDEMFEILTWAQLGIHGKPVGVLNVKGYYNRLIEFIDNAIDQRFIKKEHRSIIIVSEEIEGLFQKIEEFRAPVADKWLDRKSGVGS
ncbi:MAG: TIGR00730 family Rossman fold protein [Fibrobacter sp.]|nr:TIGR00730 family Rossman fold protein [Fibrobacter sp.]